MAVAATAVKLHLRMSRFQEAAVVLQERVWVQEAVGDLAKGGKFLLNAIAGRTPRNIPPSRVAMIGSSGILIPSSRPTTSKAGGVTSGESHVANCNLGARRDMGLSHNSRTGIVTQADLTRALEDEDCSWETDPNGCWLGSFQ